MNFDSKWILDKDHKLIEVDLLTWAKWFESEERHVAKTEVKGKLVSTVFLGIDHGFDFSPEAKPLLFETMIFPLGSWSDLYCDRYATWEEAEEGHKKAVALVEKGLK